ncbi:MAG: DUF2059 domain-containing protein [Thermoanaerobaculia bacterium]
MKRRLAALSLALLVSSPLLAQGTEDAQGAALAKERWAKVRKLMVLCGADQLPTRIADSVVTQFRGYHKDLPEELFTRFRAQLDLEEMMNRIQAVYDKNFTDEELDGLIAFYSTPVGQSVLHKQTAIAEQTSATSGEWGEKIGQQLIAEITRARTEKKAAPPASPPPAP